MLKFWSHPQNSHNTSSTPFWNQSKTFPEFQSNPALQSKNLQRVSLPLTVRLSQINLLPTLKPCQPPSLTTLKELTVMELSSISFLPPTLDWSLWPSIVVWAHIHHCCRCLLQSAECWRIRSQIQLVTANVLRTSKTCCVEWFKLSWLRLAIRLMMSLVRN